MKISIQLLLASLFIVMGATSLFAQTLGFNYQAIARDNGGDVLSNSNINLRFQIKSGTPGGTLVYQETYAPTTNNFGLINVIIGKGTVETGIFSNINWASASHFLIVEINGSKIDTTEFQAVPYTKIATDMSLADLKNVNNTAPSPQQVLSWDGGIWTPTTPSSYSAGSGIDISGSTISNTAPDQTVSLTGAGSTSISGTYPNFTITSTGSVPYVAGTGIDITGTTVTNTAPDQAVNLTDGGATTVSGSYPNFTISSTDNVNDADASTTNEIQSVSLSGNTLSLSLGGGSVSLASFKSPWLNSGSNLYFNTGKVGIGDNSPVATLTVGNGDKLQIHGADGDIVYKDDQGSLRFANSNGSNAPMIHMFQSGTNNSTRMFVAHSPSFPSWGIQYNDTADAFNWIGDNLPVFHIQLSGQQRIGVGTFTPEAKVHINTNSATGFGHLKLTETQFDYSRITMNNDIHSNYWDIAGRTDTNLANAQFNIYHSNVGDILSVNARGRIGINDASPSYTVEIDGNQSTRIMNLYNNLATTTNTTYNYGVRVNLSQQTNTGFPRLYNFYGISTDSDAYLTYGLYGYASGASSNNYGVYAYAPTSSGYAGYFNGNVYSTGSYLPSDARLKSEVVEYKIGLEKIMALKPSSYIYNTSEYEFLSLPEGEQYGFVAQEIKEVLPELINHTFQPYDEAKSDTEEGQGFWFDAVNYTGLIPIMVSAMQEQQAQIVEKDAQLTGLSDKIDQLEKRLIQLEAK